MKHSLKPTNGSYTDKKGFTLVEVMIAMFVTSVLIAATYFMFIRVSEMNQDLNKRTERQDTMRLVSTIIERDIRTSTQYLTVDKQAENEYNLIILDEDGNQVKIINYKVENNNILKDGKYLFDNVSGLFMDNTNDYIYFELTSTYKGKENYYAKKVYLRQN